MTKAQKAEQAEAIAKLREWLKPGDTVYTVLEHVSASGMSRTIKVVIPYIRYQCDVCGSDKADDVTVGDCCRTGAVGVVLACSGHYTRATVDHIHPNHSVALALDYKRDNARGRDGIKIGGCGMDMGFAIVYALGRKLFPEGFKVNGRGRNGDTSGWDNDGGYALKHRWL